MRLTCNRRLACPAGRVLVDSHLHHPHCTLSPTHLYERAAPLLVRLTLDQLAARRPRRCQRRVARRPRAPRPGGASAADGGDDTGAGSCCCCCRGGERCRTGAAGAAAPRRPSQEPTTTAGAAAAGALWTGLQQQRGQLAAQLGDAGASSWSQQQRHDLLPRAVSRAGPPLPPHVHPLLADSCEDCNAPQLAEAQLSGGGAAPVRRRVRRRERWSWVWSQCCCCLCLRV